MTPPLLVILGETATGKSKLAVEIAKRLNGEIICADSWTVRREVNIGTDKPGQNERSKVRHYLLDIVEPCEDFTAAVFKRLADEAIYTIYKSRKLPIMVGGSGLYIDSVLYSYGFLKAGDRELRKELNELNKEQLLENINGLGLKLSPDIDLNNKRRLIRLIETNGGQPVRGDLRHNTSIVGVRLQDDNLKELIEKRVDKMLKAGLENEVRSLSEKFGWGCEALKGVGYKQWQGYFNGQQSLAETRQLIINATNQLAKKQRTWFKRNKSIHWFNQPVDTQEIVDLATTGLAI